MKQYFIHDGQIEKGPFDIEQLKLESIKEYTPIWHKELQDWTTASELEELKPLFSNSTPPPIKKIDKDQAFSKPKFENSINEIEKSKTSKKSFGLFAIVGAVIIAGIVGWLIYQNQNQADALNEVQQQVAQQKQKAIEEKQRQEQQALEEKQKQEEKDRINAALTEKYMGYRNSWFNYISATHSSYTINPILGGISDLAVVVSNKTDKVVDEVLVRVDYMKKKNGGLYKSETVAVTNIGPNSTKSVSAPPSDRGTSVEIRKIESITAKSFHFCYPNGMDGNQNTDPYFCK